MNPGELISLLNARVMFFSTFAIITSELWRRNERRPAVCENKLSWNCVHLVCVEQWKHWVTYFLLGSFSAWLMGPMWETVAASKQRSFPSVTSPRVGNCWNHKILCTDWSLVPGLDSVAKPSYFRGRYP